MITVKELLKACEEQLELGNGDKFILLPSDDEGNEYRPCHYTFSEDVWDYTDPDDTGLDEETFNNCVILGQLLAYNIIRENNLEGAIL